MLTGRWPFEDELANRASLRDIKQRFPQVRGELPKNPAKFVTLPEGLDEAVLKCLQFEPAKRFQSARELAKELARYLEGTDRMWPESAEKGETLP
jgi:serine/threonine protein kinase